MPEYFQKTIHICTILTDMTEMCYLGKTRIIPEPRTLPPFLTPPPPPTACFPSNAKIHLQNGKSIRMSEMKIGDQIQTGIMDIQRCFTNIFS